MSLSIIVSAIAVVLLGLFGGLQWTRTKLKKTQAQLAEAQTKNGILQHQRHNLQEKARNEKDASGANRDALIERLHKSKDLRD